MKTKIDFPHSQESWGKIVFTLISMPKKLNIIQKLLKFLGFEINDMEIIDVEKYV